MKKDGVNLPPTHRRPAPPPAPPRLSPNATQARLEAAEAALREIRDSTFRSALMLRAIADRYLSTKSAT